MSESVRSGFMCDGLRGRLPEPEALSVGVALAGWQSETAFGTCQQQRAEAALAAGDALTAAWEHYLAQQRR